MSIRRSLPSTRPLVVGLIAALAVLASVFPAASDAARRHQGAKPTIVFVHGAWADGSGFDAELTHFRKRGYRVTAVPNPLRGLTADSDYVRARLQAIEGPIVLVAHSYGGAVITNAARGVANVKSLVYLAGFALDEGDSVNSLGAKFAGTGSLINPDPTSPTFSFDTVKVPNPAAPDGTSFDTYIKAKYYRAIFAGDVSRARAQLQYETQRPLTDFASGEASGPPAWKTIPSWYLMTTEDHAISPPAQAFMAKRAGARVTKVKSAHDVMISHPAAANRIIQKAIDNG